MYCHAKQGHKPSKTRDCLHPRKAILESGISIFRKCACNSCQRGEKGGRGIIFFTTEYMGYQVKGWANMSLSPSSMLTSQYLVGQIWEKINENEAQEKQKIQRQKQ